jgi:hypothetical protein
LFIDIKLLQVNAFVTASNFHPSLIFASMSEAYLSGAPMKCHKAHKY